ncbi:hypothetical protein [Aeribacillus alveayuensis]|jgi:hypothetical protein
MYQYQWRTAYSTAPSDIFDENGNIIGTIRKTYSSPIKDGVMSRKRTR